MRPLELSCQGGATAVASPSRSGGAPYSPSAAASTADGIDPGACPRASSAVHFRTPSPPTMAPLADVGPPLLPSAQQKPQLRSGEGNAAEGPPPPSSSSAGAVGPSCTGDDARGGGLATAAAGAAAGAAAPAAMKTDEGREASGPGAAAAVVGQAGQTRRPRKIYGRLPKFSPFLGTFQHAPPAGNRSRAAFFEQHLMSEEEHERRKRIRTNPFTGTFHYFPGRYSALHGLQRFRGQAAFLHSFDELDRLAALGRRVSQRVREADNPAQAASFLHGVFATPAAAAATPTTTRRSLYPHKTKEGAALHAELAWVMGGAALPRYRYGGAVDTFRRFGASLDDGCLTMAHKARAASSSLYADVLYRWNGFRLHHVKRVRPLLLLQQQQQQQHSLGRRHGSVLQEMGMGDAWNNNGLGSRQGSSAGLGLAPSHSMSAPHGSSMLLTRTTSVPSNMNGGPSANSTDHTATAGQSSSNNNGGYRSLKGRTPAARGLDVLGGGSGGGDADDSSSPSASGDERDGNGVIPQLPSTRRQGGQQQQQQQQRPPLAPRAGAGARVATTTTPVRGPTTGRPPLAGGIAAGAAAASRREAAVTKVKVGDRYDVAYGEVLGEGSYAAVYGARIRASGEVVAVKAIKRRYLFTEEERASVRGEVENMRRLPRHRNIIALTETFETAEHVYLVMERSTHGSLEQMLQLRRKLTELEAMWVMKQLLDAVSAMHGAGVLHCDIKPHNLLFSDPEGAGEANGGATGNDDARVWLYTSPLGMVLKVCDFGLSRKVPDARYYKHTGDIHRVPFSRMVGTCGFIPPEIMRKQAYGMPADMWGVGVVCYKMLTGTLPFMPPAKCLEQPVSFRGRVWETISKDAQDFMASLLVTDPNKRATVRQALGHRWLQTAPEWGPDLAMCGGSGGQQQADGGDGGLMRAKTIGAADEGDGGGEGDGSGGGGQGDGGSLVLRPHKTVTLAGSPREVGGGRPRTRSEDSSYFNESRR